MSARESLANLGLEMKKIRAFFPPLSPCSGPIILSLLKPHPSLKWSDGRVQLQHGSFLGASTAGAAVSTLAHLHSPFTRDPGGHRPLNLPLHPSEFKIYM